MNYHKESICLSLTQPLFLTTALDELFVKIFAPNLLSFSNVLLKPKLEIGVKDG